MPKNKNTIITILSLKNNEKIMASKTENKTV